MQHLSRADSEEIALAEMAEQKRNKFLHLQLVLIGDVVVAEEGSVHLVQGICRLVKVGTRSGVCGQLDSLLLKWLLFLHLDSLKSFFPIFPFLHWQYTGLKAPAGNGEEQCATAGNGWVGMFIRGGRANNPVRKSTARLSTSARLGRIPQCFNYCKGKHKRKFYTLLSVKF